MTLIAMEYYYQVDLKEKEKLERRQSQRNRGKSPNQGIGIIKEKFQNPEVNMEDIIIRKWEDGFLEEDTMEEEIIFPKVEEEEEEEKWSVMPMEI
jgi:hypothetical protein